MNSHKNDDNNNNNNNNNDRNNSNSRNNNKLKMKRRVIRVNSEQNNKMFRFSRSINLFFSNCFHFSIFF